MGSGVAETRMALRPSAQPARSACNDAALVPVLEAVPDIHRKLIRPVEYSTWIHFSPPAWTMNEHPDNDADADLMTEVERRFDELFGPAPGRDDDRGERTESSAPRQPERGAQPPK
jgi:hypothetical protein